MLRYFYQTPELILRIILGRKIKVIRVNGQEEVRNAEVGGRNITLDVCAMDENGQEMDIEVQGKMCIRDRHGSFNNDRWHRTN